MYPRPYANYTLLEQLATGGMSQVDLARRSVDDAGYVRFLVVKRIRANHVEDEAFVRMFKDEARITSELRHTHIAQVYDFGRVGEEYYLALEYVPGTDLRVILSTLRQRRQRMPVRIALKILHDVLDALQYAHTRTDSQGRSMNIVHRDVNPRNIMVSVGGEVKLIDFGVARASDRLERTQTDHFKGKVAYMAPEQISGGDALDHRVDLFALGLTLYEMLVGAGPFAGMDQTQILFRIMQGRIPSFAPPREWGDAGRSLAAMVNKALAVNPDARYRDAEEMRRALVGVAEVFGGLPYTAELREWLHELDPELEPRVRQKMESWSGPLPLTLQDDGSPSTEIPLPLDTSGTLDAQAIPPNDSSGSGTVTRTVVMTGVGMAGVLVIGIVALFAVALIVVGAIFLPSALRQADSTTVAQTTETTETAEPAQEPQAAGEQSDESQEPSGGTRADPSDASADTDTATPLTAPKPAARPPLKAPPSEPEPAETPPRIVAEPEPEPTLSIVEVPAEPEPEPEPAEEPSYSLRVGGGAETETLPETPPKPEPAPPPEPAEMGKLTVFSANRGAPISIDGKRTPYSTGDVFEWPAGTFKIIAEGHEAQTVTLHPKMSIRVRLNPE